MNLGDIKVKLAPSKIHGIGVFALKDIKKGEKLYCQEFSEWYSPKEIENLELEIKQYILERWPSIINGSAFGYPFEITVCYMNHSDDPSYEAKTDLAIKDIPKDSEVFEDYRLMPNYEKVFPFLADDVVV